jgi:alpha-glutamyl/putrescinyl thymine pyrophosphorylase clade 1
MVKVHRSSTPTRRTRPNPDAVLLSSPSRPSKASSRPTRITVGDTKLKVTHVLDELYHWTVARHGVYLARVQGRPRDEWTDDTILRRHKFTNVFRELDRVTQYEIHHVINRHPIPADDNEDAIREAVFRVLIFKIFNRPSTWELLNGSEVGPVSWKTFDFDKYKKVLDRAHAKGVIMYNPAYQILPPMEFRDYEDCPTTCSKHLKLVALMMEEGLAEDLMASNTIEEVGFSYIIVQMP